MTTHEEAPAAHSAVEISEGQRLEELARELRLRSDELERRSVQLMQRGEKLKQRANELRREWSLKRARQDSNLRPDAPEASALSPELRALEGEG